MKNLMMNSIAEVTSQYNLLDVTGDKLPEVNAKIYEKFKKVLEDDGIVLETFTLVPNPDEQTKEAIQKVLDSQNALAQAKVEKEKAEVEAEKARITAQGKADAMLISAKSEAEANELLMQSLTPEIIQNRKIEKWDGKMPTYMSSGDSGSMLMINPQ
jgi:regulator of protease activity HflC (stomatin/prohibitin superfamily)